MQDDCRRKDRSRKTVCSARNSWDERWRTDTYTERLKSLLSLDLDEGIGSDPLEAPGFRLQLVQEPPKEFRLEFQALHSRDRSRGNSGGDGTIPGTQRMVGGRKGIPVNGSAKAKPGVNGLHAFTCWL